MSSHSPKRIKKAIRELRPNDTIIEGRRRLTFAGHDAVGQTLLMEALRDAGFGPSIRGGSVKQSYYPELNVIVIDLDTVQRPVPDWWGGVTSLADTEESET